LQELNKKKDCFLFGWSGLVVLYLQPLWKRRGVHVESDGEKTLKKTKIFIKKVLVDKEKVLYICTRFESKQTFIHRD